MVLNLVVNALDSMEEGGRLTIRLVQRDGMAELHFTDTGCGMTQEVLENIFEPFFTRSRTGKGTGLGLTISHRIISQHGGEIEATSPGPTRAAPSSCVCRSDRKNRDAAGPSAWRACTDVDASRAVARGRANEAIALDKMHSCARRKRPRRHPGTEAMTDNTHNRAAARDRVETHRSLRVLFVDDEKPLQEFMRSELPRLGHEVTVCPDGKAALKALEKSIFDAAILDLRMPGMTGIEVLEHLKKVSSGHRSGRDDRPRQHGNGRRGDAAGRLRLHHQAVQAGRDRGRAVQDGRAARAETQEPGAAKPGAGGRGAERSSSASRRPMARRASHHRHGGPDRFDGADSGRNRHRQGTGRAGAVAAEQAQRHAVRAGQLRRPAPRIWSRANCSAIARAPSPGPTAITRACSRWPTAARCSSTSWAS